MVIEEFIAKAQNYGISVRLILEEDAEKIVNLRTDLNLSAHISKIDKDITSQIKYIREYKIREEKGLEYYFAFGLLNSDKPLGFYRIYNIDLVERSFTIGSWIFEKNILESIPILADILSKEFGFIQLDMQKCYFDVRRNNKKVLKYHNLFSPVFIREDDEENNYYYLTKSNFELTKKSMLDFLI